MIRPETAGELVRLMEEGRVDEIDPVWIKETYEASAVAVMLMLQNQSPMQRAKNTALSGWLIFVDELVMLCPELVTTEWGIYLIDEQERFAVWGAGISLANRRHPNAAYGWD